MLSEKYFSKVLQPKPAGKNRKNVSLKLFDTTSESFFIMHVSMNLLYFLET